VTDSHSPGSIVVVGGGLAGLSAAFELTKPGLFPGETVVVYQMGWRLGGKCASGRDDQGRIIEHGLHVWFGYYENAFRLLQEVYTEWAQLPGNEDRSWETAISPQTFTPIGLGFPIVWPDREGVPGDGTQVSILSGVIGLANLLSVVHGALAKRGSLSSSSARLSVPIEVPLGALAAASAEDIALHAGLDLGIKWLGTLQQSPHSSIELGNSGRYFNLVADEMQKQTKTQDDLLLGQLYDITAAFVAGVIDDILVQGVEPVDLDQFEFREWLVRHGADHASAYESPVVKALYDTMFQYPAGQTDSPSYGAGTAAQVVVRLLGTYKGSAVWLPQGSLGEVLMVPLYQVLRARGVQFRFFHKLERIELAEDETSVARLHFLRQLNVPGDAYEPTITKGGATYWPSAPKWECIENGEDMRNQSMNLESRWCDQKTGEIVLEQGVEFADVVLAIPLGGFKRFPRRNGPCDALMRASAKFRAMADNIQLVPSFSVQAWCTKTLTDLGWTQVRPAMVSGPQALQIWADMSQILGSEGRGASGPLSLHYFCNVFDSPQRRGNAAKDANRVRELAVEWFKEQARKVWPKAGEGTFDWNVLFDPNNRQGEARIDAQALRPNVDPVDCCASSAAGSTQWRLKPRRSGFARLILAGAWTDTGLNTECLEAAVMSGKQASRCLCGSPKNVYGERFFHAGAASASAAPGRYLIEIASLLFG
jgi:uncharacterized protein with NAD-binding domain and iron-sulfur cluster